MLKASIRAKTAERWLSTSTKRNNGVHSASKPRRFGRLKAHGIVCRWVKELQSMCMKHHTLVRVGACTVPLIANNGCSEVLHRHTNLVASSGFNGHLNQSGGFPCVENVIV